jgi:DNA modification methylase
MYNFLMDKTALTINTGLRDENFSDSEIIKKLKKLGQLHKNFEDTDILLTLASSINKNIRLLAVDNLAKIQNKDLLDNFLILLEIEETSIVRREITSAIGRLRHSDAIPILKNLLNDPDPNVTLQSIRGLLVFKDDKKIIALLKKLKDHRNELVRKIISIEFFDDTNIQKDHQDSPSYLKNCIINDDVITTLKKVDDQSIHLTFTSPPYYNARDYSLYDSYDAYIEFLANVFREVHRVTKEGRFFVLNTSPIIIPRVGRKYSSTRYPIPYDLHHKIISMGWEFIDDIIWVKPEPSAKNRIAGFNMHRKPLAYKPNCVTESIMVYRKKSNKLIDWIYDQYPKEIIEKSKINGNYETSNLWKIDPSFSKDHSAIFPLELCDRVIKFYSFEGDLVFDPFGGSGSVGISARKNKRNFFLTELDKKYFEVIKKKLQGDLFNSEVKFSIKR